MEGREKGIKRVEGRKEGERERIRVREGGGEKSESKEKCGGREGLGSGWIMRNPIHEKAINYRMFTKVGNVVCMAK